MKPEMDRKQKRIVIKMVSKNLTQIYKTAYTIAKEWDKNTILLTTVQAIIDKAVPQVADKEANIFIDNYKKTLSILMKELTAIAKRMDSKSIPLKELKAGLNVIKDNFIKGFTETDK